MAQLLDAITDEFAENEDLPNTTNPDDWARISGKKGERIVYIRTLVSGKQSEGSRAIDTASNTGSVPVAVVTAVEQLSNAPERRTPIGSGALLRHGSGRCAGAARHAGRSGPQCWAGRPTSTPAAPASCRPDRSVESFRDNTFRVLDAAVAAGVDWIDTARSYGRAEEFVGQWWRLAPRRIPTGRSGRRPSPANGVTGTSADWNPDADVHEVKDHSLERFERAVRADPGRPCRGCTCTRCIR